MKRSITALFFALVTASALAQQVAPDDTPLVRVTMSGQKGVPTNEVIGKRIYVFSDGDTHFADVMRSNLKQRGYAIAENEGDADIKLKAFGMFRIAGKGMSPVNGKLGEISGTQVGAPSTVDYTKSTVKADHVAVSAIATGISAVSITDLGIWLSQQTGVSGFFNKMLTGDPRGFCMHENCSKFEQRVVVALVGDGISVQSLAVVHHEKLMMDKVADKAVLEVINSFPESVTKPAQISAAQ